MDSNEGKNVPAKDGGIERCGERSVVRLRENLTEAGIMAAAASPRAVERNYTRVFGRDAAICAPGMVVSGDPELEAGACRSLRTLAEHQAANGQIPKFVDPLSTADFWYVGCIDATLWWLLAVDFVKRQLGAKALEGLDLSVERALNWLHCQEHPRLRLLQQNEASDWADIMPRSGFVLYTNTLWYAVKRRYGVPSAEETKYHFNHLFYPFSREVPDYRRLKLLTDYVLERERDNGLYLSFVNLSFWGGEGDVLGNLLAVIFGLAEPGPAARILDTLDRAGADGPVAARAVLDPIGDDDRLWRGYMLRHGQNLPDQYHNGGCWPFIGGLWAVALACAGRTSRARRMLQGVARANERGDWDFNEWFHGRTGEACGMSGQSWNAGTFLLAAAMLDGMLKPGAFCA